MNHVSVFAEPIRCDDLGYAAFGGRGEDFEECRGCSVKHPFHRPHVRSESGVSRPPGRIVQLSGACLRRKRPDYSIGGPRSLGCGSVRTVRTLTTSDRSPALHPRAFTSVASDPTVLGFVNLMSSVLVCDDGMCPPETVTVTSQTYVDPCCRVHGGRLEVRDAPDHVLGRDDPEAVDPREQVLRGATRPSFPLSGTSGRHPPVPLNDRDARSSPSIAS